jgi:hypothetical protein
VRWRSSTVCPHQSIGVRHVLECTGSTVKRRWQSCAAQTSGGRRCRPGAMYLRMYMAWKRAGLRRLTRPELNNFYNGRKKRAEGCRVPVRRGAPRAWVAPAVVSCWRESTPLPPYIASASRRPCCPRVCCFPVLCHAAPWSAVPRIAPPGPARPRRAMPRRAVPRRHASAMLSASDGYFPCRASQCHATPSPATPAPAPPSRAAPCSALPGSQQ